MTVSCGVCQRTGEPPIVEPEVTQGPWLLIQFTALRQKGDSENEPETRIIVCSRSCAIEAVMDVEVRDAMRGGFVGQP